MANYIADKSKGAVNPYNFVSLGNAVERSKQITGNNSGVIHCKLVNSTPLAIPDLPIAKKIKCDDTGLMEHKETKFFKIDGKPVIPGSEIRGVIRSAYETLSNSCFSVNNNNILSARSSDVRTPGIIRYENRDNKWHLYKATAKKLKYDGSEDFDETPDTFKRLWRNYKYKNKRADYRGGKVEVTYKFSTTFEEVEADDLDRAIKDYIEVCKIYVKNDSKIKKYIPPKLNKDGTCYPLYYKQFKENGGKYVYLSPAQISRSVFKNKLDDLLETHSHCTDPENVCDACRMFGMIGNGSNENISALASKVRFTDAVITNNPVYSTAILKELASPKISSVEFYSTIPDMQYLWTYDSNGIKINGRKFYFHHNGDYTTAERTKRNMTTELVDKGAEFHFDVFFDRITDDELHKLVWTLAIGENNPDGIQQHKLGHGKPLGLGSVKITVDSIEKRFFDKEKMEYTVEKPDIEKYFSEIPFDDKSKYFSEYMCITDFSYVQDKKVAYPYGDNKKGGKTSVGSLVWFSANHNDGKMVKSGDKCSVSYSLPKITDKNNLSLPVLIAGNDYGKTYNNNHSPKNNGNSRKGGSVYRTQESSGGFFNQIKVKKGR